MLYRFYLLYIYLVYIHTVVFKHHQTSSDQCSLPDVYIIRILYISLMSISSESSTSPGCLYHQNPLHLPDVYIIRILYISRMSISSESSTSPGCLYHQNPLHLPDVYIIRILYISLISSQDSPCSGFRSCV